ncbi:hypothetical protein GCM10009715_05140 [Paeniglutamicibacter psychrophenolicus]
MLTEIIIMKSVASSTASTLQRAGSGVGTGASGVRSCIVVSGFVFLRFGFLPRVHREQTRLPRACSARRVHLRPML